MSRRERDDEKVVRAMWRIKHARTVKEVADAAGVSPRKTSAQLVRLESLGLVNIHRIKLSNRWYVRHIVAVEIAWRSHEREPATTSVPGLSSVEGVAS